MSSNEDFENYAIQLTNEVFETASDNGESQRDVFAQRILDSLHEGGFVHNPQVEYLEKPGGVLLHGYGHTDDGLVLELYTSAFSYDRPRLNKSLLDRYFRRVIAFLRKAEKIKAASDPKTGDYRMCEVVLAALENPALTRIRIFFMTSSSSGTSSMPEPNDFNGIPVEYHLYDLPRIYKIEKAGIASEQIEVKLDPPLPCLPAQANNDDHSVYLAVIPGRVLAELYDEYRTRLLQLNVRAFLQARGKVNKGIRDTAVEQPAWFLAYNNGITATASDASFEYDESGRETAITSLTDLQIVNGGQTTATLHHVFSKDKNALEGVDVQMKLTLVSPDKRSEVVRKISEYSNTQNRVSQVDFSSNDKFHVKFEAVSRNVWAPPVRNSLLDTRWFYVRTRGAYEVELNKNTTTATRRKFKAENPPFQKFDKTSLAKYVNCWMGKPYKVALGAQKNFVDFQGHVTEYPPLIDATYVQRTIALKMLFTAVDSVARAQGAGSNKSAVTAYTMAMLCHVTGHRIDLDRIWREQANYGEKEPKVTSALLEAIESLCTPVMKVILNGGSHPIEWAKKPECWTEVQAIDWKIPAALEEELRPTMLKLERDETEASEDLSQRFQEVATDDWQSAYEWGQETDRLEPVELVALDTVVNLLERGEVVSDTRALRALEAYDKALQAGFDPEPE
ncbi:AIPR family protein [Nocardiopsis alba]|uniref:AIPR family protein n=1 Tax=Nocardiopsis alba TaxID=53437 RepID=UPI00366AEB6E